MVHTRVAQVQRTGPHRITITFIEGHTITAADLAEIFAARRTLAAGTPMQVLGIIPLDLEFHRNIILTDHYRHHDPVPHTIAMALVYPGTLYAKLLQIYTRLRKAPFPVHMFPTVAEAEQWLLEQAGGKGA